MSPIDAALVVVAAVSASILWAAMRRLKGTSKVRRSRAVYRAIATIQSGFLDIRSVCMDTCAVVPAEVTDPGRLRANALGGATTADRVRTAGSDQTNPAPQRRRGGRPDHPRRETAKQGQGSMKTVALYARVSSEKQAQQDTVASQVAALQERAQADGQVVLPSDIYIDEGYSGATLARPGLERLRDRVAEGGLDVIYVHNPDRLARRYVYQVLLLEEFARCGVQVIFLQGTTGQSAEDELLVQVQGMIAEYERAKIMERYRRGKLHKAQRGFPNPLSGAPYGYIYNRKTDHAPASYHVLLHESKVVRSVFQWYVEEQASLGEIARRLSEQKVPTRTGKTHWDRTTVWGMLQNPAYMGQAAYGKTEAVERGKLLRPIRSRNAVPRRPKSTYRDKPRSEWLFIPVPAIITKEMFDAAQEQLQRNIKLAKRNNRGERYLLQGLTVCAKCRYAYYGKMLSRSSPKGKNRYAYYRCTGTDGYRFDGGPLCTNQQVRADQLDEYVWESVQQLLQDPAQVLEEWTRRGAEDGTVADLRAQRGDAQRLLTAQEQTLRRLGDAYEAGALDLDDLTVRSERVRAQIAQARQEVERVDKALVQTSELKEIVGRVTDFAERVRSGLEKMDWNQRRQLIRTLVARVEIDEEGATVVYRVPASGNGPSEPPSLDGPGGAGSDSVPGSIPLCGGRDQSVAGQPVPALRVRCLDGTELSAHPVRALCG
jgi:site-specific DNA recombinase